MNKIKKILITFFLFFMCLSIISADDFPYQVGTKSNSGNVVSDGIKNSNSLDNITKAYLGNDDIKNESSPFIYYVSKVINYFLAILGFISTVVLIYGFSLVFTDKTDEGVKKGMKYVKMASIAIIIIGISWLFSMWIFGIYSQHVANT